CVGAPRISALPVPSDPPPVPGAKPPVPLEALRLATVQGTTRAVRPPSGNLGSTIAPRVYRVRPGDTLAVVARRLGVMQYRLVAINRLSPPYHLTVGQSLRLPSEPSAGRRHVVARGETLYRIALRNGVTVAELTRLNGLDSPDRIRVGQTLVLPGETAATPDSGPTGTQVAAAARPEPVRATGQGPSPEPDSSTGWSPNAVIAALQSSDVASPAAPVPKPASLTALPNPAPREGGKFLWPVHGPVVAGYGPKKDGLHNDGINIAAPRGSLVRAAENGVVAYAGNELRGFGNLLLIKHDGGWVTAYGHAEEFLVRRGDRVRRGQPIARVGTTGNVARPQLHFEIREGTRAVDPLRLLEIQSAEAS
ncbi:MAG TPA: peptidoglycan DD-metalloendopeptidase family protein, partial [Kiloniellales bacterium]|nr:peptidoglycan DD-metalloendopeptidase family protein [Kiloniellales bacterium]